MFFFNTHFLSVPPVVWVDKSTADTQETCVASHIFSPFFIPKKPAQTNNKKILKKQTNIVDV